MTYVPVLLTSELRCHSWSFDHSCFDGNLHWRLEVMDGSIERYFGCTWLHPSSTILQQSRRENQRHHVVHSLVRWRSPRDQKRESRRVPACVHLFPTTLCTMATMASASASPGASEARKYVAKMTRMRQSRVSAVGSSFSLSVASNSATQPSPAVKESPATLSEGATTTQPSILTSTSPNVVSDKKMAASAGRRRSLAGGPSSPVITAPPTNALFGWYSGIGGTLGLEIRLEVHILAENQAVVNIHSASQSIFNDRLIDGVGFVISEDTKSATKKIITWSKDLMIGLKGSVVSQVDATWNTVKNEVSLCIWLKLGRWVPAVALNAVLKRVGQPVGPYPMP